MNKQGTIPCRESAGRYAAVRPFLDTFDIINCDHKDLFWRLIGHTAMVYRDPATGQMFVYESTSLNKFSGISGVQLTPMRMWLKYYPGQVKVRRVLFDEHYDYAQHLKKTMMVSSSDHIRRFRGVPYPDLSDKKQRDFVINAAIDLPFGIGLNEDRHDIMFCTHMVVDAWQDWGGYIGALPPVEWQPDDMRPGGKFERELVDGVSLGEEIRIK